jgi:voltage-gated sodium channel
MSQVPVLIPPPAVPPPFPSDPATPSGSAVPAAAGGLVGWCQRVAQHPRFSRVVVGVIVLNAAVLGAETSPAVVEQFGRLLHTVSIACLMVFCIELAIRMTAFGQRPARFFRDGWNTFDFVIVTLSLLPMIGPMASIGRTLRLLRIARLLSVSPQMRLIVNTMLRSIPSIAHVSLLLAVLLYMYAVTGVYLFRESAPDHFGDLGRALLTMFQVATVEGWPEVQADVLEEHGWAWVFFASFIVIAVFVCINLFIAVVINNLEKAKGDEAAAEEAIRTATAAAAAPPPPPGASGDEIAAHLASRPRRDAVDPPRLRIRCSARGRTNKCGASPRPMFAIHHRHRPRRRDAVTCMNAGS